MKSIVLIKQGFEKSGQTAGDVVGIFPSDHVFSQKEIEIFTIGTISDEEDLKVSQEIADYHKTNMSVNGLSVKIKKTFLNGKLNWLIG